MPLDETTPRADQVLTPELIEELRARLIEERQKILKMYENDVQAGRGIETIGTEDMGDRAKIDDVRDLLFAMSSAEREKARLIETALSRMDRGTYGLCQYDHVPIPVARLRVVPWARFCADHQEMAERGVLGRHEE